MFQKFDTSGQYGHSFRTTVGFKDVPHNDTFTGLMSKAFVVMFDKKSHGAEKKRVNEEIRDAEFQNYVDENRPFMRYIP